MCGGIEPLSQQFAKLPADLFTSSELMGLQVTRAISGKSTITRQQQQNIVSDFSVNKSGLHPKTHWQDIGSHCYPHSPSPREFLLARLPVRPTVKWNAHSVSIGAARHRPKHPPPPWVLQRLGWGNISHLPRTVGPRATPRWFQLQLPREASPVAAEGSAEREVMA